MKILSGVWQPNQGQIFFAGKPVRIHHPNDARRLGIEMVYQNLALADNMEIAENVYMGREPMRESLLSFLVDHKGMRQMAQRHLDNLRIRVQNVTQRVEELSGGQRQAVAIARATAFSVKVLIMDEPTAALAIKEVGKVLDLIKELKGAGVSIILISHRMDDIFTVCDRVVALYRGQNFAGGYLDQVERDEVIGWVMGNKKNGTDAEGNDGE